MDETDFSWWRVRTFAFSTRGLLCPAAAGGFATPEGEHCVRLAPLWEALLSDLEELGPTALISHNSAAMLGRTLPGVAFLPVPLSTEFVEQHTGLVVETARLASALAVEEVKCGGSLFSLQFFDAAEQGVFKLLLTTGADLDFFLEFTRHYASQKKPSVTSTDATPPTPAALESTPDMRALWPYMRHELPGGWLPGVCRVDVLASLGPDLAIQRPFDALLRAVLAARRDGWPLRFGLDRNPQRHEAVLVPRWIESCAGTLHIFDRNAEVHLFPERGGTLWQVRWAHEWALEWFDAAGERLLTVRGPDTGPGGWEAFLETLA